MQTETIENNSKGNSTFFDVNMHSNIDVCPFTLEAVRDCKTRNSVFENNVCFFMLETCYYTRQDKLKKIACRK